MKYCTNCKVNRQSYAEHYSDYNSYSDNQCWICEKYTLTSSSSSSALVTSSTSSALTNMQSNLDVNKVERGISQVESRQIRGFEEKAQHYNRNTGEYKAEIVQYTKDYVHYEQTRKW